MRFKRPSAVEIAVLAVAGCLLAYFLIDAARHGFAKQRAAEDARRHLSSGIVIYRLRGLARPWQQDAVKAASERFGIKIMRTGGCVCSGPDCSYDMAYNRIVEDHLTEKFGFDPVQRVFNEAHSAWKARVSEGHPDERPASTAAALTSR
jgi:hypothetical protein